MPTSDEIEEQRTLLSIYRRNMVFLVRQKARHGDLNVPLPIINSIEEASANIQRIKVILRGWDQEVEDLPQDRYSDDNLTVSTANIDNPSRRNMMEKLQSYFFVDTLANKAPEKPYIQLNLITAPDEVADPLYIEFPKQRPQKREIPHDKQIIEVFDELSDSLLILGEPG
ncbi:MAG: hypothetical protein M3R61_10750, partial [Chloroflexota bacterium]|nr:hypothetical protein [Chloroflexota bacterium]